MKINKLIILIIITCFIGIGCAPAFSEFQDAKVTGKGNIEATPYYTSLVMEEANSENDKDIIQTHFGLHIAYGITNKFDIRAKYEIISPQIGLEIKAETMNLGLKYNLIANEHYFYSLFIPISRTKYIVFDDLFEESNDTENNQESFYFYILEPTLLLTFPFNTKIELNPSIKMLLPLQENATESGIALNFGLGYLFNKIIIRPEFGILFFGDESFQHYGIGLS